jgi:DNA-binding NtrC family response regulator
VLKAWPWPGNIRELENLMERVLVFADGPNIEVKDLPEGVRSGTAGVSVGSGASGGGQGQDTPSPGDTPLKEIVKMKAAELEKELIIKALDETQGNVTRAAKLLQISRKSLQTKMKEFGLRDDSPLDDA